MLSILNGDIFDILPDCGVFDCLIADPPDNIGLKYTGYKDKLSEEDYLEFLNACLEVFSEHAGIIWISYNAKYTYPMGALVYYFLDRHSDFEAKPFIQTFTFGQNRTTDCGNGHRPILRLKRKDAPIYPDQIKIPSWRLLHGDPRASKGGKVPLDTWDFPRVTGNSRQRRPWCPTQLHEGLVERMVNLSTQKGGTVCDAFSGSGTTMKVCRKLERDCTSIEIDPEYCKKIKEAEYNEDL